MPARISFKSFFSIVLILNFLFFIGTGCQRSETPPNIILIVVDDLGVSDAGFMGNTYYETPNIDRLAEGGMIFSEAYAAAAVCSPTRAAIMTGKYPARLHLTDWIRPSVWRSGDESQDSYVAEAGKKLICPHYPLQLDTSETTIAELLKKIGYATKHIGKWHLGGQGFLPEDQGFDINFAGCDFGQPPSYHAPYDAEWAPGGIPGVLPENRQEYLTDREALEAVNYIKEHKDQPFFLNLWHYAVHTPIQPKEQWHTYFQQKASPDGKLHPGYAAMIKSVDEALGRIVETLQSEGLLDHTLIILTSDNGGHNAYTSNKPWRSGKGNPWEGGVRVPQIFYWPEKIAPGSEFTLPVSSIDFLPTLCDIAGLNSRNYQDADGVNLTPAILKNKSLDRTSLYWHFPHYRAYEDVRPYSIVREGDWKLIHFWEGSVRLYNLENDPAEERDLADINRETKEVLQHRLSGWLEETNAAVPRVSQEWVEDLKN